MESRDLSQIRRPTWTSIFELLARVGAESPRRVVDPGCGPGNLTQHLMRRWPEAIVEGLDSSAEMVAAAREQGVTARVGDIAAFVLPATPMLW